MLRRAIVIILLLSTYSSYSETVLESGSLTILNDIQQKTKGLAAQQRIKVITEYFLGTPYNNKTLNMVSANQENLVVNLKALDCMTFIEYTEALKRSDNYEDFLQNLKQVRYSDENISYINRHHFFTDWSARPDNLISDVTQEISHNSVEISKHLNLGQNGKPLLATVPIKNRVIHYIPTRNIDKNVLNQIQTGDYIGIYSPNSGLDVSHVGIAIWQNGQIYFRNASSLKRNLKVVDIELNYYLKGKPGIIVLRSR